MSGQLHAQAAHIHRLLAQLGDLLQCGDRIPLGDGIADLKEILPVGNARHAADQGFVHSIRNTGAGIQDGEGVTHGAVRQTADEFGSVGVQVDLLFPCYIKQPPGNVRGGNALKIIALAAGQDGGRDFLHLGGGEDEDDVFRGFLHGFEQGVESRGGQHVHLVDDIDLVLAHGGQVGGLIPQVADVIHAVVGGSVDLGNIQHAAVVHAFADDAHTAGIGAGSIQAVDRLGKDLGAGGLAGAPGAGEQVGMADAPGGDLVLQCRNDGLLADYIGKTLGTPFAVQRAVHA